MARLKRSLRLNMLCHNRKQTTREMLVGYKVTAPGFFRRKVWRQKLRHRGRGHLKALIIGSSSEINAAILKPRENQ